MEEYQISKFLDRQSERGLRPASIRAYHQSLKRLMKVLEQDGRPTRAEDITLSDLEYFIRECEKRGCKSIRLDIVVAKLFQRFHTGTDVIGDTRLMISEHQPRRLHLTKTEFGEIYAVAPPDFRMAMIMGAGMGLRVSEMVSVRWSDIVGDEITVTGKGHGSGKTASILIPEMVRCEMNAWKQTVEGLDDCTDGRILGRIRGDRLLPHTTRTISDRGRQISKSIDIDFTMHSFRRLYATTLYRDAHTDLATLRLMMRHASLETTLIYLRDSEDERKRSVNALGEALGNFL